MIRCLSSVSENYSRARPDRSLPFLGGPGGEASGEFMYTCTHDYTYLPDPVPESGLDLGCAGAHTGNQNCVSLETLSGRN